MTEDSVHANGPGGGVRGLTAADIYHREFKRVLFGGFAMREVDEFLERVCDTFEALTARLQALEERDREQGEQLEAFRQMEDTLRNTLVTSQKFGENIVEAAKREADALVEEARMLKARAQFEAAKLPVEIAEDIRKLQEQRARLRTELLSILETHKSLLSTLASAEERKAGDTLESGPASPEPEREDTAPESRQEPPAADDTAEPEAFFSSEETWE